MALKPGDRIGIIGGGQLGRMLALAAARLGFRTSVLDPQENAPAFQCSNDHIIAPFNDQKALATLAGQCDVITYEFENIDVTAVEVLEDTIPCHPNSKALATSQDRLVEKEFFNGLGIETAPYHDIPNRETLEQALEQTQNSGILKTRRFGYDGKGQVRLNQVDPKSFEDAVQMLESAPCLLEGLVPFERELSVIAARSTNGETAIYDLAENVHRDGILFTSTLPAKADKPIIETAEAIAVKVLNALDYVGILAIELFVLEDGRLLVNEFAPRVHNSGHWTEAACAISQFEQHIRAVAGLPLGSTNRHSDCRMENLIGDEVEKAPEIASMPDTLLHLYGKEEVRAGRKMGHFTTLSKRSN